VDFSQELINRSGYDRDGFAAHYDRFRPRPPQALLETLLQVAAIGRAAIVVDVGAGTGLSARAWSSRADRVIGVEPNLAMLDRAKEATSEENVEYVLGFGHDTGLPDACADLVTCSQSFHWMDPTPTLAETARILRPGGVFAAYDYDVVPVCDWEAEQAFRSLLDRRRAFRVARGTYSGSDRWPKESHLERIEASGHFHYVREVVLHSVEEGSAGRLIGLAYSVGLPVPEADDDDVERELRYREFEDDVHRVLGNRELPFRFGYRVRLGVR
jgi:ubiquinone/menaquinone biosynthesis C-methylase UbiE